jgi:crotonobetainyl-CoA:carnitine CoA-transferase CaiB-like acyl-CoA transferase
VFKTKDGADILISIQSDREWRGYHPLRTAGMTDCVCASRAAPPDIPSRQA